MEANLFMRKYLSDLAQNVVYLGDCQSAARSRVILFISPATCGRGNLFPNLFGDYISSFKSTRHTPLRNIYQCRERQVTSAQAQQ
jgi:hypothetical protein